MKSRRPGLLFRYTWLDAWQVLLLGSFFSLHVVVALATPALGAFGLLAITPVFVLLAYLSTLCAHNHVHTPIFRAALLNRALDLVISCVSRGPQAGYAEVHKGHHDHTVSYTPYSLAQTLHVDSISAVLRMIVLAYVSAFRLQYVAAAFSLFVLKRPPPAPRSGGDATFDGYFEGLMAGALERIGRSNLRARMWIGVEVMAGAMFAVALCVVSPVFMLLFYVPVSILRDTLFLYSEYCHHYGADDRDTRTDSVSSYGGLSNFLTFNVAYHQEHHARPGVHWSRLPELRAEMAPEAERRVIPHSILLNPLYPIVARSVDGVGA